MERRDLSRGSALQASKKFVQLFIRQNLFIEKPNHFTIWNRSQSATLVHVADFSCGDESVIGISALFPEAGDITIHQLNLHHTLR